MLKTNVLVSQITNLTDARYFGAWGVNYLGFCLDQESENFISPARIKEIISWIEGPEYFAEFHNSDDGNFIEFMSKEAGLSTALIGYNISPKSIANLQDLTLIQEINGSEEIMKLDHAEIIVWKTDQAWKDMEATDKSFLKTMARKYSLYLDMPFEINDLDMLLSMIKPEGIVLRGGAEEKVGFKSYEDLDEIFEALEE